MKRTIFYSWQSDLNSKDNHFFIEGAIKASLKKLACNTPVNIELNFDKATRDVTGSPDISSTIFNKITSSNVFIADISFINPEIGGMRKTPNPNVLIELGYAVRNLGWDNIILIFNEAYGSLEDLPFDLRNHRVMRYSSDNKDAKKLLADTIRVAIRDMHQSGLLNDKILDFLKKEIDKEVIGLMTHIIKFVSDDPNEKDLFKEIQKFGSLDKESIINSLKNKKVLGFYVLKKFDEYELSMKAFVSQALSSSYYKREIVNPLIDIYEWFSDYQTIKSRYSSNYLSKTNELAPEYRVVGGGQLNSNDNLPDRYLLMKSIDSTKGVVVNFGDYHSGAINDLTTYYIFKDKDLDKLAACIHRLIANINSWVEATNGELIVDFVKSFRVKKTDGEWL
jgi:hypothetical protein